MADLEAVLADVSYLIAMEKSKTSPSLSVSKKIVLPDRSVRSVVRRHLDSIGADTFEAIFGQYIGFALFKDFCLHSCIPPCLQILFYDDITQYEKLESDEDRLSVGKEIYDKYIMKELLSNSHRYSEDSLQAVQETILSQEADPANKKFPNDLFEPYKREIEEILRGKIFQKFLASEKYTRFLQWKYIELNLQLTMNDFSVHRIIGRGGFGEVYGCRKTDTGKMYAMKCLDKKRIKMKQGESLALNERNMLSIASQGDACPFIVSMTYAFQTSDKLCFILDLMNGGDLHYHLSQHGPFDEKDVRFYAAEIILGLEHMHVRKIVYRDLKPANVLLDEGGHVRISDLGLAYNFSNRKPQVTVGTHGYMAPEVVAKGVTYDSTADWFSFGCVVYKLLKGHSPCRQQKSKDKCDYEKVFQQSLAELADVSPECRTFITQLLCLNPTARLGSSEANGAADVKAHGFFRDINWQDVQQQKLSPPLIPPRGEVNAADAFDIGNFDEGDTKGIKLTEADQEQYKYFSTVISQRWQQEIIETVFESINQETDRAELKRASKFKAESLDEGKSDLVLQGALRRLGGGSFGFTSQLRYGKLYPNRLELHYEKGDKDPEVFTLERILSVEAKEAKGQKSIVINVKNSQEPRIILVALDEISWVQWQKALNDAIVLSREHLTASGDKASKIYGAAEGKLHFGSLRSQSNSFDSP